MIQQAIYQRDLLPYLLHIPRGLPEPLPLLLFLHGFGERGTDLKLLKQHGPPKLLSQNHHLPFIVISPQCPLGEGWWASEREQTALSALLAHITITYPVDKTRIYLSGLSMGGFGTWHLACKHPEVFAAAVPICGGGMIENASALRDVPLWAFHGEEDEVVPVSETYAMVEAVRASGGTPRMTIYAGVAHDSWSATYENPELYDWLLTQQL